MDTNTMLELERMQQMLLSTPQSSMVIIRLMMLCEQMLEPLEVM